MREEIAARLLDREPAMPERVAVKVSQIAASIVEKRLPEILAASLEEVDAGELREWKRRHPAVAMELAQAMAERARARLRAFRQTHWENWRALAWLFEYCGSEPTARQAAQRVRQEEEKGTTWCLTPSHQRRLQQIRREWRRLEQERRGLSG